MTYIYTHDIYVYEQKLYPPGKLTYPPTKAYLKMIFLLPRWDMLISWRVYIYIYINIFLLHFLYQHGIQYVTDRPTHQCFGLPRSWSWSKPSYVSWELECLSWPSLQACWNQLFRNEERPFFNYHF